MGLDYKLVRIVHTSNGIKVNVYSFKANCWKMIEYSPPYPHDWLSGEGRVVEGCLNWLGWSGPDRKGFILTYDLRTEKLSQVLLPHCFPKRFRMSLNVWRGCLCLSWDAFTPPPVDLWVRKEYNWVKTSSFSEDWPVNRTKEIWTWISNGKRVTGFVDLNRKLISDSKRGSYEIESLRLVQHFRFEGVYIESLVSPDGSNY